MFEFDKIFMSLLDYHASLKKKILRDSNAPYIIKKKIIGKTLTENS